MLLLAPWVAGEYQLVGGGATTMHGLVKPDMVDRDVISLDKA